MSSVWLLCAARSNVRELTEEVERRCPRAQLMRMGCEQGISDVARVLLQVAVGAAVSFDEPATAQRVVRELVGAGWSAPIVVLVARKDAEAAANLFAAGATEVIAAEGAACDSLYQGQRRRIVPKTQGWPRPLLELMKKKCTRRRRMSLGMCPNGRSTVLRLTWRNRHGSSRMG